MCYSTSLIDFGNEPCRRGPGVFVDHAENRRDPPEDVVALPLHDKEPDPVRHLQVGVPSVLLAVVVVVRGRRAGSERRADSGSSSLCTELVYVVPVGVRVLRDQVVDALRGGSHHVARLRRHQ